MNKDQFDTYQQGYNAYLDGADETSNPYNGLSSELWSDGWQDAEEDEQCFV